MADKNHLRNPATTALFEAILSLQSMEECYTFFEDLCTMKELADMAQRLEAAKMLLDGKTYEQPHQPLHPVRQRRLRTDHRPCEAECPARRRAGCGISGQVPRKNKKNTRMSFHPGVLFCLMKFSQKAREGLAAFPCGANRKMACGKLSPPADGR